MGSADEEVSPRRCKALVDASRESGGDITIRLNPAATHSFDDPGAKRQRSSRRGTDDAVERAVQFCRKAWAAWLSGTVPVASAAARQGLVQAKSSRGASDPANPAALRACRRHRFRRIADANRPHIGKTPVPRTWGTFPRPFRIWTLAHRRHPFRALS
jgi:hypothetical protein